MMEKRRRRKEAAKMNGKKLIAVMLGGFLFLAGPTATLLPEAYAAPRKAPQKADDGEKAPPRKKGGKPEVLTYERAMEIENNRHERKLTAIKKFYRHHPPKRRLAIQKENEFHAKRIEEIEKQFGVR